MGSSLTTSPRTTSLGKAPKVTVAGCWRWIAPACSSETFAATSTGSIRPMVISFWLASGVSPGFTSRSVTMPTTGEMTPALRRSSWACTSFSAASLFRAWAAARAPSAASRSVTGSTRWSKTRRTRSSCWRGPLRVTARLLELAFRARHRRPQRVRVQAHQHLSGAHDVAEIGVHALHARGDAGGERHERHRRHFARRSDHLAHLAAGGRDDHDRDGLAEAPRGDRSRAHDVADDHRDPGGGGDQQDERASHGPGAGAAAGRRGSLAVGHRRFDGHTHPGRRLFSRRDAAPAGSQEPARRGPAGPTVYHGHRRGPGDVPAAHCAMGEAPAYSPIVQEADRLRLRPRLRKSQGTDTSRRRPLEKGGVFDDGERCLASRARDRPRRRHLRQPAPLGRRGAAAHLQAAARRRGQRAVAVHVPARHRPRLDVVHDREEPGQTRPLPLHRAAAGQLRPPLHERALPDGAHGLARC